ncbi:MAG TPA: orotidine-5'-phosphate decarboxylase [Candidatus Nanoarchaeia archaeon]|nr:orotidine-5'-phosphate decarboxylase [Candidatus Nanoarchaeia archaeon]
MSYLTLLRESARQNGSIACMGLDMVVEALPGSMASGGVGALLNFYERLFREMRKQGVLVGAFKPNHGFYEQHDEPREGRFSGSQALSAVMTLIEGMFPGTPIILDYKRGDIDRSSANYAAVGFKQWKADAVTVSPYMGSDSIAPFTQYCNEKDNRGVYILNRTSNPGAADIQGRIIDDDPSFQEMLDERLPVFMSAIDEIGVRRMYNKVAQHILDWAKGKPGVGAVVGATGIEDLSQLAFIYAGQDIPLLVPGVGKQGGSAQDVIEALRAAHYDLSLARINSSSGLTHPWKKSEHAPANWAEACTGKVRELNEQIGYQA